MKGGTNGGFKRMGDRMKEANGLIGLIGKWTDIIIKICFAWFNINMLTTYMFN